MGMLGAIGSGLAEAGGAMANMGRDQFKAIVEGERQERLVELQSQIKLREDETTRGRNKADAADERGRVAGLLSEPVPVSQGDGMLAPATGDASELTATSRKPTNDEMVTRAVESGDLPTATAVEKLDNKDKDREIKTAIAMGKFENALKIAELKGEFGMMLGELKAASANGSGKATELMRNWEHLKGKGYKDSEIPGMLLSGKVGEYESVSTERQNDDGSKTTRTVKTKPGEKPADAPKKAIKFGELK